MPFSLSTGRRHGAALALLVTALGSAAAVIPVLAPVPAAAQSAIRTSSIDTSQPIEITAQDSLEWADVERVATFRGEVKAVQGTMTLYADTLKVHVAQPGAKGAKQAPPQAGQSEGQQGGGLADAAGEISKIEADGHVQIITPNESARGDVGVYDVNKGMITLTGAVKLTQGRSQLEGERLVLDLNKGRSTLESGRKGPVRGLFVPEKK
ncbi:LptA/OstA family protein [Tistrella mobilis]|jgi:lipopolysaccharide export system protein LptA|uniref:LptA/OstA family protein n=1 Tax=Tistrella TaxID=171436 RepID=UPI0025F87206|nr:LptA/OstA family protein [Tistrella sp.]